MSDLVTNNNQPIIRYPNSIELLNTNIQINGNEIFKSSFFSLFWFGFVKSYNVNV